MRDTDHIVGLQPGVQGLVMTLFSRYSSKFLPLSPGHVLVATSCIRWCSGYGQFSSRAGIYRNVHTYAVIGSHRVLYTRSSICVGENQHLGIDVESQNNPARYAALYRSICISFGLIGFCRVDNPSCGELIIGLWVLLPMVLTGPFSGGTSSPGR